MAPKSRVKRVAVWLHKINDNHAVDRPEHGLRSEGLLRGDGSPARRPDALGAMPTRTTEQCR